MGGVRKQTVQTRAKIGPLEAPAVANVVKEPADV